MVFQESRTAAAWMRRGSALLAWARGRRPAAVQPAGKDVDGDGVRISVVPVQSPTSTASTRPCTCGLTDTDVTPRAAWTDPPPKEREQGGADAHHHRDGPVVLARHVVDFVRQRAPGGRAAGNDRLRQGRVSESRRRGEGKENEEPRLLPSPAAAVRPAPATLEGNLAVASVVPARALEVCGDQVDPLENLSVDVFDWAKATARLPAAVYARFREALATGAATSDEDQKAIADCLFAWAREHGAVSFAHWFFPNRGGGGGYGGMVGALKMDTMIDLEWSSAEPTKPFKPTLPHDRLFAGETDGSSFPNGGLRATHRAAAFTTWDRSSPCYVLDKVLRIPCAFVTHLGACLDDKTPLLRSNDALQKHGLRLLKNIGVATNAMAIHSFLGWEQEFFIVRADLYRKRPDLVNCGRTLIGRLPRRHQQGELNYFAPPPMQVEALMDNVRAIMLRLGVAMAVQHNEVACAQHEMSPIYCQSTFSCDNNVLFMEVMEAEAEKLGLHALFHEKPFAGINGSGKHNNWSVGTDTGLNFFYPGKTDEARKLFVTSIACLAHGLKQHNEVIRCCVAHAGNDHRLGAQEAPPAIISLHPGTGFEKHVDSIIAGGDILGYNADKSTADPRAGAAMPAVCGVEDRNRTAPFPFCGNRFEFRAVGSSQSCSLPIAMCNTIMASGFAALSSLIESGMSHRDAVAKLYTDNRQVIFTGDGYSKEWPAEAARRGLPNLNTTPLAVEHFNAPKAKALFEEMGIFSAEECDARAEVMLENYVTTLGIEVATLISMVDTAIVPACRKDLLQYETMPQLAGDRPEVYDAISEEATKLKTLIDQRPKDLHSYANFLCDEVKPQMLALREKVDAAEGLIDKDLYPYPTYDELIYSHHS